MAPLLVITDTNFWMDVQLPFPFAQWLEVDDVVVVIPFTVVKELDGLHHADSKRKRDRAKSVLKYLHGLERTLQGLVYEALDTAGNRLRFLSGPEPGDTGDDRILGVASRLRDSGEQVVIASSDFAMEIQAGLRGLDLRVVPEKLKIPDEVDPLDQQVAALKKKVAKLEEPQRLDVDVSAVVVFPREEPLQMRRLDLPSAGEFARLPDQIQVRMANRPAGQQEPPALVKYHSELPEYASRLAEWIHATASADALGQAAVLVDLRLTNRSTIAVSNSVLSLKAPAGLLFGHQSHTPEPPRPPLRPEERVAGITEGHLAMVKMPQLGFSPVRVPPAPGTPRVADDRKSVEIKLQEQLLPERPTPGGQVWIALLPAYPNSDLVIRYTLYTAAASKPSSGTIKIRAHHYHEPWRMPELPTYLQRDPRLAPLKSRYESWISHSFSKS